MMLTERVKKNRVAVKNLIKKTNKLVFFIKYLVNIVLQTLLKLESLYNLGARYQEDKFLL